MFPHVSDGVLRISGGTGGRFHLYKIRTSLAREFVNKKTVGALIVFRNEGAYYQ